MISRAKSSDYQKKAKDRQKKLSSSLKKEAFGDGLVYLESLCEQIDSENTNPTHYFFSDETELELTQEQAAVIIDKFNQLSEEHKNVFVNMIVEKQKYFRNVPDYVMLGYINVLSEDQSQETIKLVEKLEKYGSVGHLSLWIFLLSVHVHTWRLVNQ